MNEFRKSRIIHNRRAARRLYAILEEKRWTQDTLARRTGIPRSVISAHFSGERRITVRHMSAYLKVFNDERRLLFDAWLEDNFNNI